MWPYPLSSLSSRIILWTDCCLTLEIQYCVLTCRITKPEKTTFHLLHLSLFREYLDWEFSELKVMEIRYCLSAWVCLVEWLSRQESSVWSVNGLMTWLVSWVVNKMFTYWFLLTIIIGHHCNNLLSVVNVRDPFLLMMMVGAQSLMWLVCLFLIIFTGYITLSLWPGKNHWRLDSYGISGWKWFYPTLAKSAY